MKKYVGIIVAGVLIAGASYGFMGIKMGKQTESAKQGSGVSFPEMMSQLSRGMSFWNKLSPEEKKQAVNAVKAVYETRDNAAILKDAAFYSGKIDETLQVNPSAMNLNIITLLRILAVMEYDYYNGENKDDLAKKTLGEKAFAQNQLRRRQGNMLPNQ